MFKMFMPIWVLDSPSPTNPKAYQAWDKWRGVPDDVSVVARRAKSEALAKTGLAMTNFAQYNGFKAVERFIKGGCCVA